jgi:DNA-binding CsgD family transcriptional regulator
MMSASVLAFNKGVLEDAASAVDTIQFRRRLMARVDAFVGVDTATILPLPGALDGDDSAEVALSRGLDDAVLGRYLANRARYWQSAGLARAIRKAGGTLIDSEVFSASERATFPVYVESMIPAGITSVLCTVITFRSGPAWILCLNRHARARFRRFDLERLCAARPIMGMADAAVRASSGHATVAYASLLTSREREVASYVRAGLQNKEIASLLGTSLNTVRKQTMSVYEKLRVAGRVELVVRLGGTARSSLLPR